MNIAKIKCAGLALFSSLSSATMFAQDVHYVQFAAMPLAVNPAFTGMFDGSIRASSIYRRQWSPADIPYVSYGTSFDAPVFINKKGNYLAAGVQFFDSRAGDGNLNNYNALASVAYHKHFGKREHHGCDIGIGTQGFYTSKSINVTNLFYNNDYPQYWVFIPPHGGVMHRAQSYTGLNIGICFSQSLGSKFNYTIGFSENNINQPNDAVKKENYLWVGLNRSTTAIIRANWILKRWAFRPSVYFIAREKLTAYIAGSEFLYLVNKKPDSRKSLSVFLGGWIRRGGVASMNGGIEFKSFRVAMAYDYNFAAFNPAVNGDGGVELSLRYIAPTKMLFSRKRGFPG